MPKAFAQVLTDSSKPTGSVTINFNASSTNSATVMLNLFGQDNFAVTGVYLSQSPTVPSATQAGWKTVPPTPSYSANPSYSFSGDDGTKTIYVWYKDATNNISNTSFDSIVLTKNDSWKNYYGIAWDDTPANHIRYAKQMGYDGIAIKQSVSINDYKTNPDSAGLKFYLVDPHLYSPVYQSHKRWVDTKASYTEEVKNWYENNMVWKSYDTFPNNLASGYFKSNSTQYNVEWDWQQQRVIDEVVERIITLARNDEDATKHFTFGGVLFDVPRLHGEFYYWVDTGGEGSLGKSTELSYWTGADSGRLHGTITHEYATYRDGKAAFYKKLSARIKEEFPNAKWILQPAYLYSAVHKDEWLYSLRNRGDKDELIPDMLSQESATTDFVDNSAIFSSVGNLTKDRVECTHHNDLTEARNRLIAAKAGINGSWYNWFGSFVAAGYIPDFQSITEVYPRLKLIRVVPNWDNLNGVPLAERQWDGSVYRSPKSFISENLIYSRHPKSGKLFAVFNNDSEPIRLPGGYVFKSVEQVDGFFREAGDARDDFVVKGQEIVLKKGTVIEQDSANGQTIGKGYIITTTVIPKQPTQVKTVIVTKQSP